MSYRTRKLGGLLALSLLLFAYAASTGVRAGEAPNVAALSLQRAMHGTYFLVRFDTSSDFDSQGNRAAYLVAQGAHPEIVYQAARGSLEFVGRLEGRYQIEFVLVYPSVDEVPDPGSGQNQKTLSRPTWTERPVSLDFRRAERLPSPDASKNAAERRAVANGDLEERWAQAQADYFLRVADGNGDFGFHRFAAQATARKYGVRVPDQTPTSNPMRRDGEFTNRALYETTTGAAAIAESLQLQRVLNRTVRAQGSRTIDIGKVPGIDIAEHPWTKMMGDRRPSPEPLAKLVPHDNYYIHFKSVRKFIEFGELLDEWGTNLTRAYEITSRDYRLQERYEKQLCLKSTWLGKAFGDKLIRELAVTGSDPYLREGSDVTAIFHVVDTNVFLAAVEPFIREAKMEFGDEWKETKCDYRGVIIDSFVTPRREVSLHRAVTGNYVIYSNSPVAVRRCLEAYQGRAKALADALDFQYMRTVFRLEDEQEEGFAFLSDAFIRQLVGPGSKIKEKRRLEALTTLYLATNGALFAAWETGSPPNDLAQLQREARLRADDLVLPEGGELTWDGRRQVAVSDVYNTFHFATPLIELPIDQITPSENEDYRRFRQEYLGLWRKYFDPVGMRFRQTGQQVRIETYILPLVRNSQYEALRNMTGRATAAVWPNQMAPKTLAQLTFGAGMSRDGSERFVLRLDDGAMFQQLVDWWRRGQQSPSQEWWQEALRMFLQLPVVAGVEDLKEPQQFVAELEHSGDSFLTAKREKFAYHGEMITRAVLKKEIIEFALTYAGLSELKPKEDQSLYHVLIDKAWYVSFSESAIQGVVDQAIARRKEHGERKREEAAEVNSSLYLAPKAFDQARPALHYFLESETQRRSLANNSILYPLYRTGLLSPDASPADLRARTMGWLGFVPVSPDGAAYHYHAKTGEVVNERHGSGRAPLLHAGPADGSPLARLLEQLQTVRADLRFREDGVQTVLTIERKALK